MSADPNTGGGAGTGPGGGAGTGPNKPPPPPPPTKSLDDRIFAVVDEIRADFAPPQMPPVPPFVASRRRLAELGVGPLYDALPPYPPGLPRSRRAAWRMATAPIEEAGRG